MVEITKGESKQDIATFPKVQVIIETLMCSRVLGQEDTQIVTKT